MSKTIVIGNWKMNGDLAFCKNLAQQITTHAEMDDDTNVVLCPPTPFLSAVNDVITTSPLSLGAQDCSESDKGAHTGDVSASMLKSIGCNHVIVGHSERRTNHGETNQLVKAKAYNAQQNDLVTIICVGENLAEYQQGKTHTVIKQQLIESLSEDTDSENTIIAYEPVWAIGTGKIPSIQEISDIAELMSETVKTLGNKTNNANMRFLYGGSVNKNNAQELASIEKINGFLVGSASLNAEEFCNIIRLTQR
jgi:triosephosphate isomerase